jgi:cytochrome c oxidase subunit 2
MCFASQHAHLISWYLNHCSVLYVAVSIALGNLIYLIVSGVIQRKQTGHFTAQIQLETIWTWIPIAYILVTTGTSLILLYGTEASNATTSTISVIGSQWQWTADVSIDSIPARVGTAGGDSDTTALASNVNTGQLRLATSAQPVFINSSPTSVALTSLDVIHGWSIPSLGIRTDCIPGRTAVIAIHATQGTYAGFCSELCGVGHAFMPITLTVSDTAASLVDPAQQPGSPNSALFPTSTQHRGLQQQSIANTAVSASAVANSTVAFAGSASVSHNTVL